jgi:hypothetical protein
MIRRMPSQYRTPLAIALVLLGAYLLVASYTPGGSRTLPFGDLSGASPGTVMTYGVKISPILVLLSVCCFIVAYYVYKNRKDIVGNSGS